MKAFAPASRIALASGIVLIILVAVFSVQPSEPPESKLSEQGSEPDFNNRQTSRTLAPEKTDPFHPGSGVMADAGAANASRASLDADDSALGRFDAWADHYLKTTDLDKRNQLADEGVRLAEQRRAELKTLIQEDPRRALEQTVPYSKRSELPEEVLAHLEDPINERGNLEVFAVSPATGKAIERPVRRFAEFGDERFEAYVYGEREAHRTSKGIAMNGIAVGPYFAVNESPVRRMGIGEPIERERVLDDWGDLSASEDSPLFPASEAPDQVTADLVAFESPNGIHVLLPDHSGDQNVSEGDFLTDDAVSLESYKSMGEHHVLVIRVGFPDVLEPPPDNDEENDGNGEGEEPNGVLFSGTREDAVSIMRSVNEFLWNASYRQMRFTSIDVTADLVLERASEAYYREAEDGNVEVSDPQRLLEDARLLAEEEGYLLEYDFVVVTFPQIGFDWDGLGRVGAKGSWVQGDFNAPVTAHEIGHNFGLFHARYWQPQGDPGHYPMDAAQSVEYGNVFDVMGASRLHFPHNHFNANFKHFLGWLPESAIHRISNDNSSGLYRLHRLDGGTDLADGRRHALRLEVEGRNDFPDIPLQDYWIEYRRAIDGSERVRNGLVVLWGDEAATPTGSHLLNMNPLLVHPDGTPIETEETPLAVGETFFDPINEVLITPRDRGGMAPHDFMDLAVTRGILEIEILEPKGEFSAINPDGTVRIPRNAEGEFVVAAQATGSPVQSVTFSVDGVDLETIFPNSKQTSHPFFFEEFDLGTYEVVAYVTNQAGNRVHSKPLVVEVTHPISNALELLLSEEISAVDEPLDMQLLSVAEHPVIDRIEFRENDTIIGESQTEPYTSTWIPREPGDYRLYARIFFEDGSVAETETLVVTIRLEMPGELPAFLWTSRTTGFNADLHGIDYGSAGFVAVGDHGTVLHSLDGETWSAAESGSENTLRAVAYGNGLYVTAGDAGTILESSDGVAWTEPSVSVTTRNLNDVAFHNGSFFVVGERGLTRRRDGAGVWHSLILEVTGRDLHAVESIGNRLYAAGAAGTIVSSLGNDDWILESLAEEGDTIHSLAFGKGQYLTAGWTDSGQSGLLRSSFDANVWEPSPHSVEHRLNHVLFENGRFLLAGAGGYLALSDDDGRFVANPTGVSSDLYDVAFALDNVVAVGTQGTILQATATPSEFANWVVTVFDADDLSSPEVANPLGDYGGFGIPNLARYALLLDPRSPDRESLPSGSVQHLASEGADYLTLRYSYRANLRDLEVLVEGSDNLETWTILDENHRIEETTFGNTREVVVRDAEPIEENQKRFMRLRVEAR